MVVLYHFQLTTIISLLLDVLLYALPYIFSEICIYLYHFQGVSTRYSEVLKKKHTAIFV